jgi:SnoaL-like protein
MNRTLGAVLTLMIAGCATSQPAERDRRAVEGTLSELGAIAHVLEDFHSAASKGDFDRYFSHWTDQSVFLGTDATERWVGGEFKEFARPHFAKGKGWTYHPHDRNLSLVPGGGSAYFDELLDNEKLGLCRGSGVLARQGGDWKILQYNLSIPIPNDLAEDFAGRIRTFKPAPPPEPKR